MTKDIEKVIRETFSYDPLTGNLFRIVRSGRMKIGNYVGSINKNGYIYVCINYKKYLVHRIAWFLHYNKWPIDSLDHINGFPLDNRISNLREATHAQNMRNKKKNKANTSGHKGVSFDKERKKWSAYITYCGKHIYLGRFETKELASDYYIRAAEKYFGQFARIE